MGEKIKEARAWTDTVFTAASGLSPLVAIVIAVGKDNPVLAWAVHPVSVPLYLLVFVPLPVIWVARFLTRKAINRSDILRKAMLVDPLNFVPNGLDEEVIRALRWLDGWPGSQRLAKETKSMGGSGSQVDVELSTDRLCRHGWAISESRDKDNHSNKTYTGYRLTEHGVNHAMKQGYKVGPKTP